MFPKMNRDVVRCVYGARKCNIQRTIDQMISFSSPHTYTRTQQTRTHSDKNTSPKSDRNGGALNTQLNNNNITNNNTNHCNKNNSDNNGNNKSSNPFMLPSYRKGLLSLPSEVLLLVSHLLSAHDMSKLSVVDTYTHTHTHTHTNLLHTFFSFILSLEHTTISQHTTYVQPTRSLPVSIISLLHTPTPNKHTLTHHTHTSHTYTQQHTPHTHTHTYMHTHMHTTKVSRELHAIVSETFKLKKTLNFSSKKSWSDYRILLKIALFPNIETLSLRNCARFRSFAALPSRLIASKRFKSLNLSACAEVIINLTTIYYPVFCFCSCFLFVVL